MTKGRWIGGTALLFLVAGLVYSAERIGELEKLTTDIDRRTRQAEAGAAKTSAAGPTTSELAQDIERLRDEIGRLNERRSTSRPLSSASAATGGGGESAADGGDPAFSDAVRKVVEEEKARDKDLKTKAKAVKHVQKAERDRTRRLADFAQRIGMDPALAQPLQPMVEEHHTQLMDLMGKLRQAPENEKDLLRQQIVQLRQTTLARVQPYLNDTQNAALQKLYATANEDLFRPRTPRGSPPPTASPAAPAPPPPAGAAR